MSLALQSLHRTQNYRFPISKKHHSGIQAKYRDKLLTAIAIKIVSWDISLVNRTAFFACIATNIEAVSCPSESFRSVDTYEHVFD